LIAVAGLTLSGCAAADETEAVSTESAEETATTAGDTYEVYALLPQGNDQPYGTTYLPPMEAKAAELGINLTITNSEYDGDKQASECEVAVAAQMASFCGQHLLTPFVPASRPLTLLVSPCGSPTLT
jgi:ribose transport system substrate-binding protein